MNLVVSQKVIIDQHGGTNDAIESGLCRFFHGLGINLYPVPNCLLDVRLWLKQIPFDALALSGGGDISPNAHENAEGVKFNHSFDRDRVEFALLKLALDNRKPIIGICRGMHQLNYYFGGKVTANVHKDHPDRRPGVPHLVACVKSNRAVAGSCVVNHFHNHGIMESQVGAEMEILAMDTATGVVEAITHKKLRILGVQWHPERTLPDQQWGANLIRSLMEI